MALFHLKYVGKLPVSGRPTIWITVGQRPTALAAVADIRKAHTKLHVTTLTRLGERAGWLSFSRELCYMGSARLRDHT